MPKVVFMGGSGGSILGIGVSIDLTWTPSVSAGIVQYNIYRSTITGGPYTLIGNAPPSDNGAALAYVDFAVARNTTYFYVATAFEGLNESIDSNEASATTRS